MHNEVAAKETGGKKARGERTMTTAFWTTPETRALVKEEHEFNQAWSKKLGWEMSDREAGRDGPGPGRIDDRRPRRVVQEG